MKKSKLHMDLSSTAARMRGVMEVTNGLGQSNSKVLKNTLWKNPAHYI